MSFTHWLRELDFERTNLVCDTLQIHEVAEDDDAATSKVLTRQPDGIVNQISWADVSNTLGVGRSWFVVQNKDSSNGGYYSALSTQPPWDGSSYDITNTYAIAHARTFLDPLNGVGSHVYLGDPRDHATGTSMLIHSKYGIYLYLFWTKNDASFGTVRRQKEWSGGAVFEGGYTYNVVEAIVVDGSWYVHGWN